MSSFKLFFGDVTFAGDYNPTTLYSANDVVKYTDSVAYRCISVSTIGVPPVGNPTVWEVFLPTEPDMVLSVTTVNRLSAQTFGDATGGIVQWVGQEWTLEKDGILITLVRMMMNCDCVCDCVCDCNCNCVCANCVCGHCVCADTDPPGWYHLPYCTGHIDCPPNCACACLCSGGSDCESYVCTEGGAPDNCHCQCF